MEGKVSGQHFVIGPPPLPLHMWLGLAMGLLMVPIAVGTPLVGGSPWTMLGLVGTIAIEISLWRLRRISVTAWDHRLVIDNGKGPFGLDRAGIAGFDVGVPSTMVLIQEGPPARGRIWRGPMVQAIRYDGRRVPLIATVRRRHDATLAAHEARLEAWLCNHH
jgi:hypothetical protein